MCVLVTIVLQCYIQYLYLEPFPLGWWSCPNPQAYQFYQGNNHHYMNDVTCAFGALQISYQSHVIIFLEGLCSMRSRFRW